MRYIKKFEKFDTAFSYEQETGEPIFEDKCPHCNCDSCSKCDCDDCECEKCNCKKNESSSFDIGKIDQVVKFINPIDPGSSKEYFYYTFWEDDAAYEDKSLAEYLSAVESSVFDQDSDTSKRFGWEFIKKNKDEILRKCKQELEESGIV